MKIDDLVLYRLPEGLVFDREGAVTKVHIDGSITLEDVDTKETVEDVNWRDYKIILPASDGTPSLPEEEKDTSEPKQSLRYNTGKPELSYILDASYAVEGIAEVMTFGAIKYDRNNWKLGFPKEKLADSLLRHLTKFLNGEELDEESGLPHVDHIGCNALFLSYHFNGRKDKAESNG